MPGRSLDEFICSFFCFCCWFFPYRHAPPPHKGDCRFCNVQDFSHTLFSPAESPFYLETKMMTIDSLFAVCVTIASRPISFPHRIFRFISKGSNPETLSLSFPLVSNPRLNHKESQIFVPLGSTDSLFSNSSGPFGEFHSESQVHFPLPNTITFAGKVGSKEFTTLPSKSPNLTVQEGASAGSIYPPILNDPSVLCGF